MTGEVGPWSRAKGDRGPKERGRSYRNHLAGDCTFPLQLLLILLKGRSPAILELGAGVVFGQAMLQEKKISHPFYF